MDQRVHVVTTYQELRHSTNNFVKIARDYLGEDILMCHSMATWLCHIDRFKWKYNKSSAKDPIFGADIINRVHKRVQVLLHS